MEKLAENLCGVWSSWRREEEKRRVWAWGQRAERTSSLFWVFNRAQTCWSVKERRDHFGTEINCWFYWWVDRAGVSQKGSTLTTGPATVHAIANWTLGEQAFRENDPNQKAYGQISINCSDWPKENPHWSHLACPSTTSKRRSKEKKIVQKAWWRNTWKALAQKVWIRTSGATKKWFQSIKLTNLWIWICRLQVCGQCYQMET